MADRDLTVHLKADDKLTPAAKKAADALEKLEKPVEVEIDADVAGVLSAFDQINVNAKETVDAAEALGRALGPDLAAKADVRGIVGQLQTMGLSIDQIKNNADELGAKLKEAADVDVGGTLGAQLGTARGQTDQLADSARGANSALANMVGNTAQDVGALGGLAGSAGVAIGQMAEYASDAALGGEKLGSALGSMAKVAGPMAALGLAVSYFSKQLADAKEIDAFNADQVKQYTTAIREGTGLVQAIREELEETQELVFKDVEKGPFGLANRKWSDDVSDNLAAVNMSLEEFQGLIDATEAEQADWIAGMIRAGADQDVLIDIMRAVVVARENQADATKTAAINEELLADTMDDTAASTRDYTAAGRDAAAAMQAEVDATLAGINALTELTAARRTSADSAIAARDAQRDFEEQIVSATEAMGAEDATMQDVAQAMDDTASAAADVADAQVRLAIDTAEASGETLTASQQQSVFNSSMLASARTAQGPLRDSIIAYIAQVNNIPPEKVSEILADPDNASIDAASRALDQAAKDRHSRIILGISYPKGYNPVTGTVGPTAVASAPAAMATTTATAAPVGVPVASMAPIVVNVPMQTPNVTINAAVIGNRYDVERTVARSLRNYQRRNGRRS